MSDTMALLQEGRRREREQTLFYRRLAALAEEVGDHAASERLNELLADEQHHVSRLTARILERGGRPEDAPTVPDRVGLDEWSEVAVARERAEVEWYERALLRTDEADVAATLREILDCERHHQEGLGGKWMPATPPPLEP